MSENKSPAFQLYVNDWLGSQRVRMMDAEQRGWYFQLLAYAWHGDPSCSLPDDDTYLQRLVEARPRESPMDDSSLRSYERP